MSGAGTTTTGRRLRADAQRNYDALLRAARTTFREVGADAPLEDIARRAGVGIGTLYRHFPSRLALLEAVYRDEVDDLGRASDQLAELPDASEAMDSWLELFSEYALTKRALLNQLVDAIGRDSELFTHSRRVIEQSGSAVLSRAQQAGVVREDVQVNDVIRLVGGATMMPGLTEDQRKRLLRVVADGLRA